MNAPESLRPSLPALAPLTPHPEPGAAPRINLGLSADWSPGFAGLEDNLQEPFIRPCDPSPLQDCRFLAVSEDAAALLGLNAQELTRSPEWLALLSGNAVGNHLQPYASVYAGHQFGVFVPRLGDGRALNLGALRGWELQLKGAGQTPYARFADGRAVLRSSIREYLCSEAMYALGIPTTRALSLVAASSPVLRETVETAAVVCRLAPSFVRFGHFEYFSSRQRVDQLERLVRHSAELLGCGDPVAGTSIPAAELTLNMLNEVAQRTAKMTAQWMGVGFMHGVMNTDNCSILGLTLDYGPFGFMEYFDAGHICNHSDHHGRYSFQSQPQVSLWNLSRLANALYPLVNSVDALNAVLEKFKSSYANEMEGLLKTKLGLQLLPEDQWSPLLDDFYSLLQSQKMDYTLAFRALSNQDERAFVNLAPDRAACRPWLDRYQQSVGVSLSLQGISAKARQEQMRAINPKYVLRNWIAEEVISAVRDHNDTRPLHTVAQLLRSPFEEHPEQKRYAAPPPDWAEHLSVSCSS
ncbi:MAG: YdiU family protein [Betaproteobacteria bacterium]|nr:YdiU family protein [Betaproteobacteria bacterium]